jgi:nucleotide-binding universal stress UspA family protein
VVVAFDGSPESVVAVRTAAALFPDRTLLVATVWEPGLVMAAVPAGEMGSAAYVPPSPEQIAAVDEAQRDHAESAAAAGVRLATEAGCAAEAVPIPDTANIADTLAEIADERDAAAIVVGSRGLGRVKSALLGSTSHRLLHQTRRPVVVVRAPE